MRSLLASLVASAAVLTAALPAAADPQTSVGLTVGGAGEGADRAVWQDTVFHLGLRGDVLFGRTSSSDFGVGPYAEVFTHAFDEIQFGGGLSTLLPISDLPLVLSAGAYGRSGPDPYGVEPGVTAQLFFGSRSYNFHAPYGLAAGLLGQFRYGLGEQRETAIVIAAQIDLQVLALPFLLLLGTARGGSPDTAPVEPEITSRR